MIQAKRSFVCCSSLFLSAASVFVTLKYIHISWSLEGLHIFPESFLSEQHGNIWHLLYIRVVDQRN